jgi:hypothetical protein
MVDRSGAMGEPDGTAAALGGLPALQTGGRVEKTGLVIVHEGEYVMAAPGSAARIVGDGVTPGGPVINYFFPLEVEVVGELDETRMRAVANYVFDALTTELQRRI